MVQGGLLYHVVGVDAIVQEPDLGCVQWVTARLMGPGDVLCASLDATSRRFRVPTDSGLFESMCVQSSVFTAHVLSVCPVTMRPSQPE